MELLIEGREEKYTFKQIVDAAHVNTERGYEILHRFLKLRIIKEVAKYAQIRLYSINKENPIVRRFTAAHKEVIYA